MPKKRFYERDIMTECADNHTQEIDNHLSELLNQQDLQNKSKDDEWMPTNQNKEEYMNECLRLIRDSPYLLKRSFLYNQEVDQMKDIEKEMIYELSLKRFRNLFGDISEGATPSEEQESLIEKEQQSDDSYCPSFSPFKDLTDPN